VQEEKCRSARRNLLLSAPNTFEPATISKIPKIPFIPEMKIQN